MKYYMQTFLSSKYGKMGKPHIYNPGIQPIISKGHSISSQGVGEMNSTIKTYPDHW